MRLKDKIAIVVGAGQGPGTGMGNGRATVIRFAQEGAKVLCVDKDVTSAEETAAMAAKETNAGECAAYEADVTREASMKAMIDHCKAKWGRVDILHYNVGFSIAGGDAVPTEITEEAFDRVMTVNLRGMVMAVKHALPVMREQKSGVILGISSLAAWENYPYVAYKASKAAMVTFCQQIAIQNAELRHPLQRDPARPDGHADGGRHARPRHEQDAATRSPRCATRACRCARRWAPPGTWRTPRCSSPRTRRTSSPASNSGGWRRAGEYRDSCRKGRS